MGVRFLQDQDLASPAISSETTAEVARRVFAGLQSLLFSFEQAAKGADVEGIHAMRVTTRRFRVALSNFAFCLPLEVRRDTNARLSELADTLGRVRDLDVMLESLALMQIETTLVRQKVFADLRRRLLQRRRYHLRRLMVYFKSENYEALKKALRELLKDYGQTV